MGWRCLDRSPRAALGRPRPFTSPEGGLRNPLRRREAVPSPRPPPPEHVSPARGAHSDAEPVYFASMASSCLATPMHTPKTPQIPPRTDTDATPSTADQEKEDISPRPS